MVRVCDLIDRPALVRVPWNETSAIALALDAGAAGVIVPCVDTPEQAGRAVQAAKFPPLGNRSYGGRRVIDLRGRDYAKTANEETLLVVQIETPEGLANVDAVAAVPGVDALFLGADDLFLRRSCPMDSPRTPEMVRADLVAVGEACRRHGRLAAAVGPTDELLSLCRSCGFQLVVAGSDAGFLATASQQAAKKLRP